MPSCSQFKGRTGLNFSKYTVHHSCSSFGKVWSLVLALLQTQKAVSEHNIRALNDPYLKSPGTKIKQMYHPFLYRKHWVEKVEFLQLASTPTDEDVRYILPSSSLKRAQHLNSFVTMCFMSYTLPPWELAELYYLSNSSPQEA